MKQRLYDNISFAALQWFFWSGFGVVNGFLVAYMENAGYSNPQIGTVMALFALSAILGLPFWGYITDYTRKAGRTIRFALTGGACAAIVLLLYGQHYYAAVLLAAASFSFMLEPVAPLIDTWTYHSRAVGRRVNYGVTRAMGSVGFAFTVAVTGRLLDEFGMTLMYYISVTLIVVTYLVTLSISRRVENGSQKTTIASSKKTDSALSDVAASTESTGSTRRPSVLTLFRNREIVAFLVLTFLVFTAFRAAQLYLPMLIIELGGTNRHLGLALSVQALSEVPLLILSSLLLLRYRDVTVLLWAFVFFTVRIVLHLVVWEPWGAVVVQGAQGLSFALFLPATVHFMYRVAPEGLKATAQTLAVAFSFGLGSAFGSYFGSTVLELGDIFDVYRYGGVLSAVTVGAYYVLVYRRQKKEVFETAE